MRWTRPGCPPASSASRKVRPALRQAWRNSYLRHALVLHFTLHFTFQNDSVGQSQNKTQPKKFDIFDSLNTWEIVWVLWWHRDVTCTSRATFRFFRFFRGTCRADHQHLHLQNRSAARCQLQSECLSLQHAVLSSINVCPQRINVHFMHVVHSILILRQQSRQGANKLHSHMHWSFFGKHVTTRYSTRSTRSTRP